jgi:hypothetical protein
VKPTAPTGGDAGAPAALAAEGIKGGATGRGAYGRGGVEVVAGVPPGAAGGGGAGRGGGAGATVGVDDGGRTSR